MSRLWRGDLRRVARRGPWRASSIAAWLFPVQFFALDVHFRGVAAYLEDPRLVASGLESVLLWSLLGSFRAHLVARLAMAIGVATILTVQWLFFRCYHVPIDLQVATSAAHGWPDVRPVIAQMLPRALATIGAVAFVEYALLKTAARDGSRRPLLAGALVVASLFGAPLRDATPELRLLPSLSLLWAATPVSEAAAAQMPALSSTREELPNVLVILTESVRATDYCSETRPDCPVAPEVNRVLEARVPLRQLRAISSYTAVSLSALMTGRTQEGSRDEILRAPNAFDILRSVRARTGRPTLAYWSAHSEAVFEQRDVRSVVDSFVPVETLLGHAVDDESVDTGVDRLLAAHAERGLRELRKPYFLVLHFADTHAPYFMNDADAPFAPWQHEITWSGLSALQNAYKNSIFEQDKHIAASIREFLATQGTSPYVIVFTSDHGEAFGEHGAIHHGQNLYDEQIHVPGFVVASPGALRGDQDAFLRQNANAFVTHLDILPTLLDAYGVLDHFALAPVRARFAGRSLLRAPPSIVLPLPITNCTGLFPCPLNTWGMLDGAVKLHAQSWDADFRCFTLGHDEAPLPDDDAACRRLREASKRHFPLLPNRQPNR